MLLKKGGVVRDVADKVKIESLKKHGYTEYDLKPVQGDFDIQTAKAGELLAYAETQGYEDVAKMSKTLGAEKIRAALIAKMKE